MPNWKKVIVSGSNASLNDITSSGNFSSSGNIFGTFTEDSTLQQVVVYDTTTGQLKQKFLSLISTVDAADLYLVDFDNTGDERTQHFKLSHDDTNNTIGSVFPHRLLSASLKNNGTDFRTIDNAEVNLNGEWADDHIGNNLEIYDAADGDTNPASGSSGLKDIRNGLIVGSSKEILTFNLQGFDNDATPAHNGTPNPNYPARSFRDGATGSLQVFVNDNTTPKFTLDLSESAAFSSTTQNHIKVTLSQTQSNLNASDGAVDPFKNNRSGSIEVQTDAQVDGWNYMYILHTGSKSGNNFFRKTNFVEWFYDTDGAGESLGNITPVSHTPDNTDADLGFNVNNTASISGIRFYSGSVKTTITHKASITNFYKNVYPSTAGIQYNTVTGTTIDSITSSFSGSGINESNNTQEDATDGADSDTITFNTPALKTGTSNVHTSDLRITSSIAVNIDNTVFHQPTDFQDIPNNNSTGTTAQNTAADIQYKLRFDHIDSHKSPDFKQDSTQIYNDYLYNALNDPDSNVHQFEAFRKEEYRIQSRSEYANTSQATIDTNTGSILNGTYAWDGTKNIVNGGTGFNEGLAQYRTHLVYPSRIGDSSNASEFSPLHGPTNLQPTNYGSSEATGKRVYYRYFKFTDTLAGGKAMSLEFTGKAAVVREANNTTNFTTNGVGIKVYFWRSKGGGSSVCNGVFKNVLDTGFRQGNAIGTDSRHIEISESNSTIDYSETAQTTDSFQYPVGVLKFEDTNGNIFTENEVVIVKIECPQGWSGNINSMALRKGITGTPVIGSTYTNY